MRIPAARTSSASGRPPIGATYRPANRADRARFTRAARPAEAGFTMVEIALSIAVVAFAMVAILGVLPTGLQVQKDNREETLVNLDGTYLLEAIRSGNDRAGWLTNSIYYLSVNYKNGERYELANNGNPLVLGNANERDTAGQKLVGLLSSPRSLLPNVGVSNVVIWARSLSGTALDQDPAARDVAFKYRVVVEVLPFVGYPPSLTNLLGTNELARVNHLQNNLHEVRLNIQWPLFNDSTKEPDRVRVGTKRRTLRALVPGTLYRTNFADGNTLYHFFRPSVY